MNQVHAATPVLFPGTPLCATTGDNITPKFLTIAVLEQCRDSCEELADSLGDSTPLEHEAINECLAACDEYTVAAARESRHTMRYAIWCSERCDDLYDTCRTIDTPAARTTAKWLKAASKQMNREVLNWRKIRNAMDKEVTWGQVKGAMNHNVIAFDPFRSTPHAKTSEQ